MIDQENREDMPDMVTERLVATLARGADVVSDGPRFLASDVVRAGRRTIRRRRAAAAAVAAVVAVGAVLSVSQFGRAPAPQPPATHQQTSPAAVSEVVDLLVGNTVHAADGTRIPLRLPAGYTGDTATRVPSGWVVDTAHEVGGQELAEVWFVPDGGDPRSVGEDFGDFAVSPDGETLVIARRSEEVEAYELPSLKKIGHHAFRGGMGPVVLGVAKDVVLLREASGTARPPGLPCGTSGQTRSRPRPATSPR